MCFLLDVWSYDEDAVKALKRMGPKAEKTTGVGKEFDILKRSSTAAAKITAKHVRIRFVIDVRFVFGALSGVL